MTTVRTLLRTLAERLRPRLGGEAAHAEARLLLAAATGIDRLGQARDPEAPVPPPVAARALALAARRADGAPLAHLTGRREFYGLDLAVGPEVLVPRPDSETLIDAALAHLPRGRAARVLDLGTGSGCPLLALLHERPTAWGVGVDRSPAALTYARRNAATLGLDDRCAFLCGDWWEAVAGRFDVVLANPPYVASGEIEGLMVEVGAHEPRLALDGGRDGLAAYRRLIPGLAARLLPGGVAVLEIGHDQGPAVQGLARGAGLDRTRLMQDLGRRNRCLVVTIG